MPEIDFEPIPVPDSRVDPNGHFRARLHNVVRPAEMIAALGQAIPYNTESLVKMILAEAKFAGVDEKSVMDRRTEGDKLRDFREALLEDPQNIYAQIEETVAIAEKEMNAADKYCHQYINSEKTPLREDEEIEKWEEGRRKKGKLWADLFGRVRQLQTRAKNAVPKGTHPMVLYGVEAAHPLRFMVYVGRSSTMRLHKDSQSDQFCLSSHHYDMAVAVWIARNGVDFPERGPKKGMAIKGGRDPYKMCLIILPPGHGKSDFTIHYLALRYCMKPRTLAMYLHAVEDEAAKPVGAIKNMFKDDNSAGRRCRALFPTVKVALKGKNNETTMTLDVKEKTKSHSLRAAGVMSARLGADLTELVLDDIVPQSDVTEETTRVERVSRVGGTFMTRLRGKDTFIICIGTMWHKDDALANFRRMAEVGSDVIYSYVAVTGGPNTSPPFFPLWDEAYPAKELRKRFELMKRDRTLWSASYEANPLAEADRIVRRVRYYLPNTPEHLDFMASSSNYASIDPTATNKEGSDRAGILYGALGEISAVDDGVRRYQTRLRILEGSRIHANQVELADHIAAFVLQRPVYQVVVETRSGFHATADVLENKYGLEVDRVDPGPKKKGVRLKEVAALIDDSSADFRALVEFPGEIRPDGTIGPTDAIKPIVDQILDFGVVADDEYVDCASQLVKKLNAEGRLVGGTDVASESVRQVIKKKGDPRDIAWFENLKRQSSGEVTVEEEESRWIADRYGAPAQENQWAFSDQFWNRN